MAWVESALSHFLQQHSSQVDESRIAPIISGLPKKVTNCTDIQGREIGYGIKAVQGWSFLRFLSLAGICVAMGLVFFGVWLKEHPGDFQNASIPYFMMLAPFTLIGILDAYVE
jgi:hypothetical protein